MSDLKRTNPVMFDRALAEIRREHPDLPAEEQSKLADALLREWQAEAARALGEFGDDMARGL
jgi:hypothetical protein